MTSVTGMSLIRQQVPGSWNVALAIQDDLVASSGRVVRPRGTLAGAMRADAQVWTAVCRVNRVMQVTRGTSRLLNEEEKIAKVSCLPIG